MVLPPDMDNEFIRKLRELVLANIGNEQFGVEALSKAARMSRSHILRRLKEVTNLSASQFIRKIRLEEALKLLMHEECSVSEIAFRLGFNSPAYFNYCFRRYYGYPPGEFRRCMQKEYSAKQPDGITSVLNPGVFHSLRFIGHAGFRRPVYLKLLIGGIFVLMVIYLLSGIGRITGFLNNLRHENTQSIIVLPFRDVSSGSEFQYFASGLTEDILNCLFLMNDMKVVSRTTAEYYLQKNLTVKEIAQKANVRYLLEGSVRIQDEKVRISAQLIDTRYDKHIWAGSYDRTLRDIMGIQTEIALAVAEKLNATCSSDRKTISGKSFSVNNDAYDYYLRGRFLLDKSYTQQRTDINRRDLKASIDCFEKAIRKDSSYALAFTGLASAWFQGVASGWFTPYPEGLERAQEYTRIALELNPDCSEAHVINALYLIWPGRKYEASRAEFNTALKLDPFLPLAIQGYVQLLSITGYMDDARRQMDRLLELESHFWVAQNLSAWLYYLDQKYDEAIVTCKRALELNSENFDSMLLIFLCYARKVDAENAKKALEAVLLCFPETSMYIDDIAGFYESSGIRGLYSLMIYINLNTQIKARGFGCHPFYMGWWYALEGNKAESIAWLKKNLTDSGDWIPGYLFCTIAANPDFDLLRDEPEFLKLIEEVGLSPYHKRHTLSWSE